MTPGGADNDKLSSFSSESDEQLGAFSSETDEIAAPPAVSNAARAAANGQAHGSSALVGGVVLLALVAFGVLAVVWWEQGARRGGTPRRTTSQAAGSAQLNASRGGQPAPPQGTVRQPDPGQAARGQTDSRQTDPVVPGRAALPPSLEAMSATPQISFRATEAVAVAPVPPATHPPGTPRPAATPDTAFRGPVVAEAPRAPAAPPTPLAAPENAVAVAPEPALPSAAAAPPVAPPPGPRPLDRAATDRAAIGGVLDQYRESYNSLDATSASTIWQGLDTRALQRAFSTLSRQDVAFDRCDVTIVSDVRATALCRGVLSYVQKIGDGAQQQRRLSWTIDFQRTADRWLIAGVTAR
jgi:hypothetical protein